MRVNTFTFLLLIGHNRESLLQHRARSVVATRVSVAGVNHVLAMLAVVARGAATFVLPVGLHHALGIVLTRERVAGIAFRRKRNKNKGVFPRA